MNSSENHSNVKPAPELQIQTVDIDGQRIRLATRPGAGLGPPLLICNGIGANLETLTPFTDFLTGVQTIVFDAPGTGGSSTPSIPYRLSNLTRLLTRLLDHLNYDQVDVMGISWGGGLAQEFARRHRDRCRRLILAATTAGAFMIPGRLSVMLKLANPKRYTKPSYMLDVAGEIYGGLIREEAEYVRDHLQRTQSPNRFGYYWQLFAATGWTSIHWLHRLRQPTLIMAGRDDPLTPPINAKLMASLIPDARIELFDCGHLFMLTHPEPVAAAVEKFLGAETGSH